MNAKEFFKKVSVMRTYQKEYSRTHSIRAKTECRRAEKEIDEEIARVNRLLEERRMPKIEF